MSGNRYLLDTNAIVHLLKGNAHLIDTLKHAQWIGISVICKLEFLSFPDLSEQDIKAFDSFTNRVDVIGIAAYEQELLEHIVAIRKKNRVKLPDAIICATALYKQAHLITADKGIADIEDLQIIPLLP